MEYSQRTSPLAQYNNTYSLQYEHVDNLGNVMSRKFIVTIGLALFVLCLCRHLIPKSQNRNAEGVNKKVRFEENSEWIRSESLKVQLHGVWELESYQVEVVSPIHVTTYPLGQNARGRLIYTKDGYMSVQIMRPGCAKFSGSNPHGGTRTENSSAAAHSMAYSGAYETFKNKDQKIVQHSIDTSLYPNWLEEPQTRMVSFDGETLILQPLQMPTFLGLKVGGILRWRRSSGSTSGIDTCQGMTSWYPEDATQVVSVGEDPEMSLRFE